MPADPGTRHLTATRSVILLVLDLRPAEFEAAKPARFVAPIATRSGRAAASAATTTAATTVPATTAIVAAAPWRSTRDAIDHVVKLAASHRAMRTLLALVDAYEPHLVERVADDIQRFEQPRRTIGLHRQRRRNRFDRRIRHRRCSLRGRVGCGLLDAVAGLALDGVVDRGGIVDHASVCAVIVDRRLRKLTRGDRSSAPGGASDSRRFAKGQRRELGERLHGRLATPKGAHALAPVASAG